MSAAKRREYTSVEPIIAGFHPDPSVCRVGATYYLANSSFEYAPGVPIWTSDDLVSWHLIGNALDPRQFVADRPPSGGIYAPTLRYHGGRFWLITTDVSTGGGQLALSAADPAGPWSPAMTIAGVAGIDPDLAWDDDGTCYVTYCSIRPERPVIAQSRVDLDRGVILEEPRHIWSGTGLAHPEAPHLYHVGGWWYLLIAEGGTERGHSVSIARSPSPTGPFEGFAGNPFFSHRSLAHPVQNTGHADLVENADGSWSMVYLGVRARGQTPWYHVNGRETFLAGIDWVDGWPVVDEERYRIPVPDRSYVDEFAGDDLDLRWVSPGSGLDRIRRDGQPGLVLEAARPGSAQLRDCVVARVTDLRWRFSVDLSPGDGAASVLLRIDDDHGAEIRIDGGTATAVLRIGPLVSEVGSAAVLGGGVVTATLAAVDSDTGPDDIVLAVGAGSEEQRLARFDGRYVSTEVAGGFTGRMVGVRSDRDAVRIHRVHYDAQDA